MTMFIRVMPVHRMKTQVILSLVVLCLPTLAVADVQPRAYGCTVCVDDCPARGLYYGEYFCYAPDGSIDFDNERMRRSRDRVPSYILEHRNRKTSQETSLRYRFMYPSRPRSQRLQASDPSNGRGRFRIARTSARKDVSTLNKTAREYMRGTLTDGFRRNTDHYEESVQVLKVINARTFEVRRPTGEVETVELAGVAVPLYGHHTQADECHGAESHAFVSRLLARRGVDLTPNTRSDPYDEGHESVFMSVDDSDVGAVLIGHGYAYADDRRPHDKIEEYEAYQATAQAEEDGLWGVCSR